MSNVALGFTGIGVVLVLLAIRMPIGIALGLVSFTGIAILRGFDVALGLLMAVPYDFAANWLSSQPVDATHALNFSAGVSNFNVFLGRSFN